MRVFDSHIRKLILSSLAFSIALGLATQLAQAKPKKRDANGCTAEQVQSSGGKACIAKAIAREIAGTASLWTYHLVCSGSSKKCCKYGLRPGGQFGHFQCESAAVGIPPGDRPNTSGGVLDPGPKQRSPRDTIPTGGGILDSGPGLGTRNPAPTGAPLSPGRGTTPPPAKIY